MVTYWAWMLLAVAAMATALIKTNDVCRTPAVSCLQQRSVDDNSGRFVNCPLPQQVCKQKVEFKRELVGTKSVATVLSLDRSCADRRSCIASCLQKDVDAEWPVTVCTTCLTGNFRHQGKVIAQKSCMPEEYSEENYSEEEENNEEQESEEETQEEEEAEEEEEELLDSGEDAKEASASLSGLEEEYEDNREEENNDLEGSRKEGLEYGHIPSMEASVEKAEGSEEGREVSEEGKEVSGEGLDGSGEGNEGSGEGTDGSIEGKEGSGEGIGGSGEGKEGSAEGIGGSGEGKEGSGDANANSESTVLSENPQNYAYEE